MQKRTTLRSARRSEDIKVQIRKDADGAEEMMRNISTTIENKNRQSEKTGGSRMGYCIELV